MSSSRPIVTDELSSSGDSKADDDADKKSPKDKDGKDRERDREEGSLFYHAVNCFIVYWFVKSSWEL